VHIFFYTNKIFRSIFKEQNFDDVLKFSNEILSLKEAQKVGKLFFFHDFMNTLPVSRLTKLLILATLPAGFPLKSMTSTLVWNRFSSRLL
jgi:hypothetical protein